MFSIYELCAFCLVIYLLMSAEELSTISYKHEICIHKTKRKVLSRNKYAKSTQAELKNIVGAESLTCSPWMHKGKVFRSNIL